MKRSGSTWQYNVIRQLVERQSLGNGEGFIPDDEMESDPQRLDAFVRDAQVHVIKTHARYDPDPGLLQSGAVRLTYTYRDVRTAAVSLKRQFGAQNARLLGILDEAVETYYWVQEQPNTLMQRYESFIAYPKEAAREICTFFGWDVSDSMLQEVVDACSVERMKSVADREGRSLLKHMYHAVWHLNRKLPIKRIVLGLGFPESWWIKLRRVASPYDRKTLLRPGHVSGAAKGEALPKGGLSASEMNTLQQRYGNWLRDADYPSDVPEKGGDPYRA